MIDPYIVALPVYFPVCILSFCLAVSPQAVSVTAPT